VLPHVIRDLPFSEYVMLRAGLLDRADARRKAMEAAQNGDNPLADAPWEAESVTTLAD